MSLFRPSQRPARAESVLDGPKALEAVDAIAATIVAEAPKADRAAAFPEQSVAALRGARLLPAAIPTEHGGHGLSTPELCAVAHRLGVLCGSTAMIWAMHQIQLACLAACADREPRLAAYLATVADQDLLLASITSEAGVGGSMRTSRTALTPDPGGLRLVKQATTASYAEAADGLLVTARHSADAAAGDQVLVLVTAQQARLRPTGVWDPLGMRATCSGPAELDAVVPAWQVLPIPFGQLATTVMVPLSHVLWAALWCGVAEDAMRRSIRFAQARLRGSTGAPNPRLGRMYARHRTMVDSVRQFAADYDAEPAAGSLTVRANALKMQTSVDAVEIAMLALEVCGMAGYSEVGEYSVSRQLRDLLSARLMISNDRLNDANSELVAFADLL